MSRRSKERFPYPRQSILMNTCVAHTGEEGRTPHHLIGSYGMLDQSCTERVVWRVMSRYQAIWRDTVATAPILPKWGFCVHAGWKRLTP